MKDLADEIIECEDIIRSMNDQINEQGAELDTLRAEHAEMLAGLKEIAKGEGRFSCDPLTHADNCIEDMKGIAVALIARVEGTD
jgi:hypothetical protein